jgi:hypothetical protein
MRSLVLRLAWTHNACIMNIGKKDASTIASTVRRPPSDVTLIM